MFDTSRINDILGTHPKQSKILAYGTAGFRDRHDLPLNSVFLRMGILASLRSLSVGKCIGVMITASHNPEIDNGIKIVDYDGGMLSQKWEPYAEQLANIDSSSFLDAVGDIIRLENIDTTKIPTVIVGRDTRFHSAGLSACVEVGAKSVGAMCYNLGEVATPQLHFVVNRINSSCELPLTSFDATQWLLDYYNTMSEGYMSLKSTAEAIRVDKIVIDAAFGVPSVELEAFSRHFNDNVAEHQKLSIDIRNVNGTGKVNDGCGAELVQKNQISPGGIITGNDEGKLLCSFDGDGDRIVFHYLDPTFKLLDGDKIATLISDFLFKELQAAKLNQFSLGIVQTAYANGASTQYLLKSGINVAIAKTGVKYVHHKALDFDIGVYFEANGHGTVLFSEAITTSINNFQDFDHSDSRLVLAFKRLQACLKLINQCVGDALSDMLLCLAILEIFNIDMVQWNAMYTDFPSVQMKVKVPDKSRITCSADETRVVTPIALQDDLDAAMKTVSNGRCFVRPSGTEDVVRIYAEASTLDEASVLCKLTEEAIKKHLY